MKFPWKLGKGRRKEGAGFGSQTRIPTWPTHTHTHAIKRNKER